MVDVDLLDVVSAVATISTVLLFLTGVPIVQKIIRKGSSSDSSFFPFLSIFCNSSLWLKYGLLKADNTIILTNSVGCTLSAIYMFIFIIFTLNKTGVYRQVITGAALLFTTLYIVQTYTDSRQQALIYLGVIAAAMGVVAYGAPLSALSTVVRTQSTEVMAFPMCLANFIVAMEWFGYGYIKGDRFIQVPNCLGIILGALQLLLFAIYPSKSTRIQTT